MDRWHAFGSLEAILITTESNKSLSVRAGARETARHAMHVRAGVARAGVSRRGDIEHVTCRGGHVNNL